MERLQKLQAKYNELHERLGYSNNPQTIEAINRRLDAIGEQMNEILNGGE